jgi:hypothetical protein
LPHICYYDYTSGTLKHAFHDGFTWRSVAIEGQGGVWGYISLVVDGGGTPQFSCSNVTTGELAYFSEAAGAWQETIVDDGPRRKYTDLTLDGGRPHISYQVAEPQADLLYAWYNGDTWVLETVDTAGQAGAWCSTAIGGEYRHVAYADRSSYGLKYARAPASVGDSGPQEWSAPALALLRVQPNPVRATADVSYVLPMPASVSLAVYDLSGRRVSSVCCGGQPAGEHRLTWAPLGSGLSGGSYVMMISCDGERHDSEIIVVRP